MVSSISVKRLYDEPGSRDTTRILVDGLWPRGVHRSEWPHRSWRPDLAPSRALRQWYRHDPGRFEEFRRRYRAELDDNAQVDELLELEGPLVLVTATRDVDHSHAAVLRDYLEEMRRGL